MKKLTAFAISALLFAALGFVAFAPLAQAHAELKECTPAIDGTVATAPEKLTCETSQAMKAEGSSLQVFDANGVQVDKGDSAVDLNDPERTIISVSLDTAKMKDGVYTVKWTTVSADDSDQATGEFNFTVGHAMEMHGTETPAAAETSTVTHPNDDPSIGVITIDGKQVTLKIVSPANDATVPAGDVKIEAAVDGVQLGEDYHLHFYLGDKLLGMAEGAETSFTAKLEPGAYEVKVTLGDSNHQDINNASVHVTVAAAEAAQATATPAATEAAPAATPAPTETAPSTLPATGDEVGFGFYALLAVLGLVIFGAGTFVYARNKQ